MKWALPPRIKVFEALGAIADKRIKIEDNRAEVLSSDGSRKYTVVFEPPNKIFSDDNGSVYRGYLGYPAIAFLMLKGFLPFDKELAEKLRGIPWKKLNEKYKRYWLVEKIIFKQRGIDEKTAISFAKQVLEQIEMKGFEKLEFR